MDTKDIIIIVAAFLMAGFSLYRRYIRKKGGNSGGSSGKSAEKDRLRDQPDDYVPYSGKNDRP